MQHGQPKVTKAIFTLQGISICLNGRGKLHSELGTGSSIIAKAVEMVKSASSIRPGERATYVATDSTAFQ